MEGTQGGSTGTCPSLSGRAPVFQRHGLRLAPAGNVQEARFVSGEWRLADSMPFALLVGRIR